MHKGHSFSSYGWALCAWILIIAFQYGYHISVLNQLQAVLTCKSSPRPSYRYGLASCIPMDDPTFSLVTAVFTVGGLAGSIRANFVIDRFGRKGAAKLCALLTAIGAALMALSNSVLLLAFGRLLVGVGSGVGLCVAPIFLSEIAPTNISGNVGVLTQLAIVFGIMLTQVAGLRFAAPFQWRIVLFISSALSIVQFILSTFAVESPAWLTLPEEQKAVAIKLWGNFHPPATPDVEDPLLDDSGGRRTSPREPAITVPQLFRAPHLRKPLAIVCLAMFSQQVSGINAVLYYSNDILSKSLPEFGPYVSLGITVVNVVMTFPPIFLIERMGRRPLLTLSIIGALLSLVAIGYGLDSSLVALSSVAILTFVTSFAIGLGPIPFVMIPEVSPSHAVSALSSVALSLNWIANFFVGLVFLPLRNMLSGGDPTREGRVFYVFVAVLFCSTFALSRLYHA